VAANKPILPRPPFPPGSYPGAQSRDLERELSNQRAALQKLFEGRADGVLALDAPPSGTWEQGALVRAADPIRTISASTTWVVLGWLRTNEGLGTLTWQELRIWETAGGGGGGFTAASMTATTTGVGTAVYAGNPAGELLFRNVQAGAGISGTTSAGAIRITNTGAAGGFAASSQTASNVGTGIGLYAGNPAGDLTFRTLKSGSDITISQSGQEVVIAFTGTIPAANPWNAASQTATNVGAGAGIYDGNDGTTLRMRTLVEGSGISITVTGSVIRIASTVTQNTWTAASQTATSTGTGVDVYVGNAAGELTFRKVQAGANISVTTSAGAIRITSTGGGLTAASITATNTGSGESVYAGNSGTELVFRKLQEGTGISLTQSAGAVKITATRYGSQIGTYGWRDNLSALTTARAAGANSPGWGTIRDGLQGWLFSPVNDNELWVSFHIDHDYAAGTALFPHIHVVPLDANGGVTRWGIEYSFAKGHNQASFGPSTTIYIDGTITAGSQYRHYIFETSTLSAISGVGIETDGVLLCRLFRNASDPGDTFSTTVAAIFADLHYQTDHIATVEKAPAFTALSWNGDTTIGGFLATSQTATSTGTGVAVYVGNAAGELTLRKVQAGTGISITTSGGAIRITGTGGGGGNSITTTAYASIPSGTVAGTLFIPSDGISVRRATGTGWEKWGPLYRMHEPPPVASWTIVGGSASYTMTTIDGSLLLNVIATGVSNAIGWYELSKTSTSAGHAFTAMIQPNWVWHATGYFGVYIADSVAQRALGFLFQSTAGAAPSLFLRPFASITAGATVGVTITAIANGFVVGTQPLWLKVECNATTNLRVFSYSGNGVAWLPCFTISYTGSASFLAHDKFGICFQGANGSVNNLFGRSLLLHGLKEN
jgi:hypothetical protein